MTQMLCPKCWSSKIYWGTQVRDIDESLSPKEQPIDVHCEKCGFNGDCYWSYREEQRQGWPIPYRIPAFTLTPKY